MAGLEYRSVLIWVALVSSVVWCVAIAATALHVQQVRSDLGQLAADVAHHNAAHHPRRTAGSRRYLDLRLRSGVGRQVRTSSLRVVRVGSAEMVEVRVEAAVDFALGGHPKIAVRMVRSAPVEDPTGLP